MFISIHLFVNKKINIMKFIKFLLIGLVSLVLLLIIFSFFLSEKGKIVERSIVIDAPKDIVFSQINDLKKWEKWSPWGAKDKTMKKITPKINELETYCKENNTITFTIEILTSDKPVSDTLQEYVKENNIGMTIMVAPKRSFFEALFHRSATREMAFSSTVPLLVFH